MDLNFKIQYKKGVNNGATDALSRCSSLENETVMATSECIPSWIQKLQEGYHDDPDTAKLLTELSLTGQNEKGFSLVDGTIRYKGRVWVGNNTLAQQHILTALHDSSVGGHSGVAATYHRVKQLFAWPALKQTVQVLVQQCQTCQQAKSEHVKYPRVTRTITCTCSSLGSGLPRLH